MKKYFIFILFSVFFAVSSEARFPSPKLSYIYFQGDKEIPFYVKLNGKMQPRYGKNYCIVSQLQAGIVNIELLFQQHAYPPQSFTIDVPEGGQRGFLIVIKSENFSLYDLDIKNYIFPDKK